MLTVGSSSGRGTPIFVAGTSHLRKKQSSKSLKYVCASSRRNMLAGVAASTSIITAGNSPAIANFAEFDIVVDRLTLPLPSRTPYDTYANNYDDLDEGSVASAFGFPNLRQRLLEGARGQVLECGVGTGINLSFYNFQQMEKLTGIDNSTGMLNQATKRISKGIEKQVELIQADVQSLPFDTGTFDSVVDTFSLCVYDKPQAALMEMARVVKPGGSVLLLAHTRSNNLILGWYQDWTASTVSAFGKGCVWNQNVPALLKSAGLKVVTLEREVAGTVSVIRAVKSDVLEV